MYPPEIGGIETVASEIAKIAYKSGFDSVALSFNTTNVFVKENQNGVKIIRLPVYLKKDPIRLSRLFHKKLINLTNCNKNLLFFHFPSFQPEIDLFFHNYQAYKICFYHADIVNRGFLGMVYNEFLVKKYLSKMDKIIVTSPNIIDSSKILQYFRTKIEVVPLFVDTKHFKYRKENKRKEIKEQLGIETENYKIVSYIGRLGRYKGLDYLIQSVSQLDRNFYLLIIGEGQEKDRLAQLVKKLALQNRVLFLKHVSYEELPLYYSASDVFVLPSVDRGEAFGLVILEALACGIPTITTKLGTGTTYHNINGHTGLHIEPKNVAELQSAINKILNENWKESRREILRNRAEDFSKVIFETKIVKILDSLPFSVG